MKRSCLFRIGCLLCALLLFPILISYGEEAIVSAPITLGEDYQDVPRPVITVSWVPEQQKKTYIPGETVSMTLRTTSGSTIPMENVTVYIRVPHTLTLQQENILIDEMGVQLRNETSVFSSEGNIISFDISQIEPGQQLDVSLQCMVNPPALDKDESVGTEKKAEVVAWTSHGGEATCSLNLSASFIARTAADLWIHGLGEGNSPISTTFQLTSLSDGSIHTMASDGANIVHFSSLSPSTIFILEEVSVAAGYARLTEKWTITVGADGTITTGIQQGDQPLVLAGTSGHYMLQHQQTYTAVQMPSAGGISEILLTGLGITFVSSGLWGAFRIWNRRMLRRAGGQ